MPKDKTLDTTRRQRVIFRALAIVGAYSKWLAKRAAKKATLWQTIWSIIWDAAGFSALSWAGFQLHSAAGWAIAGVGCFFMANRFRPSNTGARL